VKQFSVQYYANNMLHERCTTLILQMSNMHKSLKAWRTLKRNCWTLTQLFGSTLCSIRTNRMHYFTFNLFQ